ERLDPRRATQVSERLESRHLEPEIAVEEGEQVRHRALVAQAADRQDRLLHDVGVGMDEDAVQRLQGARIVQPVEDQHRLEDDVRIGIVEQREHGGQAAAAAQQQDLRAGVAHHGVVVGPQQLGQAAVGEDRRADAQNAVADVKTGVAHQPFDHRRPRRERQRRQGLQEAVTIVPVGYGGCEVDGHGSLGSCFFVYTWKTAEVVRSRSACSANPRVALDISAAATRYCWASWATRSTDLTISLPPCIWSVVASATCWVMRFITSTEVVIWRVPSACSRAASASCWVTCCMVPVVLRICAAPVLCSRTAPWTSRTSSVERFTAPTICCISRCDRRTASPVSRCTVSMNEEISRAEPIERSARRLTSSATTAK